MKRPGPFFRILLFSGIISLIWSCTKRQEAFFPIALDNNCTDAIVLSSQSEVNNFSLDKVPGHLTITGSDITDLSGLAGLDYICGNLKISFCQALSSLEGLPATLTVGGDLIITGNKNLTSLYGLPASLTILNRLEISLNDGLSDVQGIPIGLDVAGRISINNNNALESLKGFPGSLELNKLEVIFNPMLGTLEGIPPHVMVLSVRNNPALTNLKGLPPGFFCQDLEIYECNALRNLKGYFPSNSSLLNLIIEDNASLSDVQELEALNHVKKKFYISNNPLLETCCGLFTLLDPRGIVPQEIKVRNNKEGCNSHSEVLDGGGC